MSTALSFGQSVTGAIGQLAGIDTYTFTATSGDRVLVRMGVSTYTLDPQIRLYSPDGALLCSKAIDSPYEGGVAEINDTNCAALPVDGQYTLLSGDLDGNETGTYGLSLQMLNNPGMGTVLSFGESVTGKIDLRAEVDTYTFTATSGDRVLVRMGVSTYTLDPQIRLYGPDGTMLCSAAINAPYEGGVEEINDSNCAALQ